MTVLSGRQAVSLKMLLRYCILMDISILYHIVKILNVPNPCHITNIPVYCDTTRFEDTRLLMNPANRALTEGDQETHSNDSSLGLMG